MGLAHEKKSYLQEKNNLFEIGSPVIFFNVLKTVMTLNCVKFSTARWFA